MNKKKNLLYYKSNAEEDYSITPISVLRYISEMEAENDKLSKVNEIDTKSITELQAENERLKKDLKKVEFYSLELKSENEELREGYNKLLEWDKKYPPNRVYNMGQAKQLESELTKCVEIIKQALNQRQ